MNIGSPIFSMSGLNPNMLRDNDIESRKRVLKEACKEFEAIFTAKILKQGLQSAQSLGKIGEENDEESKTSSTYKEFAYEQMAYFAGRQQLLGISEQLYKQLVKKLEETSHNE